MYQRHLNLPATDYDKAYWLKRCCFSEGPYFNGYNSKQYIFPLHFLCFSELSNCGLKTCQKILINLKHLKILVAGFLLTFAVFFTKGL